MPILDTTTECVPQLGMAKRPNCWTVLFEYVIGL